MPKRSDSEIQRIKKEIQKLIVQVPGISAYQISQILDKDYEFICRLKKEVEKEIIDSIQKDVIDVEVKKFQLFVESLMPVLWNMLQKEEEVFDENGNKITRLRDPMEKIAIIKTMVDLQRLLFEMKLNAGWFSKQKALPPPNQTKGQKENKTK
jgi:hypothetical protein